MSAVNKKLTALANAIRGKAGLSEKLSIEEMTKAVNRITTGGGNSYNEDAIISGKGLTAYVNNNVENIKDYTFYHATDLTYAEFANCKSIGYSAF